MNCVEAKNKQLAKKRNESLKSTYYFFETVQIHSIFEADDLAEQWEQSACVLSDCVETKTSDFSWKKSLCKREQQPRHYLFFPR